MSDKAKNEMANWINGLAGDYVEAWVGHQIAEAWQKDRDKIAELEAERDALREALLDALPDSNITGEST